MQASDIMTRNIVSIGREAQICEAIRLMLDNHVSGLPVVDAAGKVVGILTEGDLLRRTEIATEKRRWPWLDFVLGPGRMASDYVKTHGRVVDELMTHEVVAAGADMPLAEIVALMERRRIKRLPIIDNGTLVGIVSRADLLAALGRALDAQEAPITGDDNIRARVLAELEKANWAPRAGLTITVTDGVVELSGVIFDEHERGALRVAAENVPGVKGILGSSGLGRTGFRDHDRRRAGGFGDGRAAPALTPESGGEGQREVDMRALLSTVAVAVGVAAVYSAATAGPPFPSAAMLAPAAKIVRVGARCGRGWHWVPPGYAKHGKWRDGHCAPN